MHFKCSHEVSVEIVGKHCEVVEKPLYISEGMMHVAAWDYGSPGLKFTKFWDRSLFIMTVSHTLPDVFKTQNSRLFKFT